MLPTTKEKIAACLQASPSVWFSGDVLAQRFATSKPTIRRHADQLVDEGRAERREGGFNNGYEWRAKRTGATLAARGDHDREG